MSKALFITAFSLLLFLLQTQRAVSQDAIADSLNLVIKSASSDTTKAYEMSTLLKHYARKKPDTSISYANELFKFLNQIKSPENKEVVDYLIPATYTDLGVAYYFMSEFDSVVHFASKAIPLYKKINDFNGECTALNLKGVVLEKQGNSDSALASYYQIYDRRKELKGSRILGAALNNIGLILVRQAKYLEAIDLYTESIKIKRANEDIAGMGATYGNIGLIYIKMEEYDKALEYFRKGLKFDLEANAERAIASDYNNIGTVYQSQKQLDSTLYYYKLGLNIRETIGDRNGMSSSLNNIGSLYMMIAQESDSISMDTSLHYAALAKEFIMKSFNIRKEIGNMNGMASCLNNLGGLEQMYFSDNQATKYCLQAYNIAVEHGFYERELMACNCLFLAYEELGQPGLAYPYYKRFNSLEDSLNNLEKSKAVNQKILEDEYKTKKIADSLANAKDEEIKLLAQKRKEDALEQESKRQQIYTLAGIILALIMMVLFFVLLRNYRVKKQANLALEEKNILILEQKSQVESQKEIIEEKNKDITDSIVYAKRIQDAMLPTLEAIQSGFPESFVMYEPKDIVAGDFYWYQSIGNHVMIAAADCTGHGVPGAMVSIVCNNGLNRAVKEFGLTNPGQILDKTREIVLHEFHASRQEGEKSDENVKDGMDIALCVFNGLQLTYSGAHNPLWIVRSGMTEIEEIKADKQPIGQFDQARPYQTHKVTLKKGDSVYIFTDGYADQFGGESGRTGGKKFKTTRLKNIILSNQDKSMDEQRELLAKTFLEWKGDYEQLDDVCVIGVRI